MSQFERWHGRFQIFITCSVSLELLQGFARGLAFAAFMQNINLSAIKKKAFWQASFLKGTRKLMNVTTLEKQRK